MNDKIKNALDIDAEKQEELHTTIADNVPQDEMDSKNRVITTEEEIASFYIVKAIVMNHVDPARITYKDTVQYFGILLDNKVTKWICRVYLKENVKYVIIPYGKDNKKYIIDDVDKIYSLSKPIIDRLTELM